MGSYLLVFLVAGLFTAVVMPLMMALGARVGVMDDTKDPPVPRVGGWAIIAGAAAGMVLVGVVFEPTGLTLLGTARSVGPVTLGALAILGIGTLDDMYPIPAMAKFGSQLAVAVLVYWLGVRIVLVSFPVGALELGPILGGFITVFWLIGITNAFNLLDGADGVAAGSAFFSSGAIFLMSVLLGHPGIGLVAAALSGALLGFLPFNFPPARAFLGDSGSMVVGFVLAGLAVEGSTKGPTLVAISVPILAFAVPVFDTTITLLRRLVRGQRLFDRDAEHLHHKLSRIGFTPRQVAGTIYLASAAFALVSMLFINPGVRSFAVVLIMLGGGTFLMVRYLRLHEINELARLARRGVVQPKKLMMNVQLRRAAEHLEAAQSFDDLLEGLGILFRNSEFDQVLLEASTGDDGRDKTLRWRLSQGRFVSGDWEPLPDEWELICPFRGKDWTGKVRLRRRLGRRSFMVDFNLFFDLVQPTLEAVAERVTPVFSEIK